jgi:enhancing lycopene biosynthesis protein 2
MFIGNSSTLQYCTVLYCTVLYCIVRTARAVPASTARALSMSPAASSTLFVDRSTAESLRKEGNKLVTKEHVTRGKASVNITK